MPLQILALTAQSFGLRAVGGQPRLQGPRAFQPPGQLIVIPRQIAHAAASRGCLRHGFPPGRALTAQGGGKTVHPAFGLRDLAGQQGRCRSAFHGLLPQARQLALRSAQALGKAFQAIPLGGHDRADPARRRLLHLADGLRDKLRLTGGGAKGGAEAALQSGPQGKG